MNPIAWVEIPVLDMERAIKFYSTVFNWKMKIDMDGPLKMSFFPYQPNIEGGSGALVHMLKFYEPSAKAGALVYLAFDDILCAEKRILKNGGKVEISKREIAPEHGFMALFIDSEGNRIGIHSQH